MPSTGAPMTVDGLVRALGGAVAGLAAAPRGSDLPIRSVALLDDSDLGQSANADLCVLVGIAAERAARWLSDLAAADRTQRPPAVATKDAAPALVDAARHAGVAVIRIHPQARTDLVWDTVRNLVAESARPAEAGLDQLGGHDDLYGLAQTVATLTGGLVSIEDEASKLLAYSATDGAADELRMLSILGREGPADYLRRLRELGVYDRLRTGRGAVDVPEDADLGWRRRMAVDIRSLSEDTNRSLGTIWLQESTLPLDVDAAAVLEGAAAVAARLIERARRVPTTEAQQIARLLGLAGGSVDVPSLAAALSLPTRGPAAVVGVTAYDAPGRDWPGELPLATVAGVIRLHASAYSRASVVAATDARVYVLVPAARESGLHGWAENLLTRVGRQVGVRMRAALAAVPDLEHAADARAEVDRVLDRPVTGPVATLADARTSVLLGEVIDLLSGTDVLHDPRLDALRAHDAESGGSLVVSLECYLDAFGDVRAAADRLGVHPNTLRYRIKRVESILGMSLADPQDRLLLQLELRARRWH